MTDFWSKVAAVVFVGMFWAARPALADDARPRAVGAGVLGAVGGLLGFVTFVLASLQGWVEDAGGRPAQTWWLAVMTGVAAAMVLWAARLVGTRRRPIAAILLVAGAAMVLIAEVFTVALLGR